MLTSTNENYRAACVTGRAIIKLYHVKVTGFKFFLHKAIIPTFLLKTWHNFCYLTTMNSPLFGGEFIVVKAKKRKKEANYSHICQGRRMPH